MRTITITRKKKVASALMPYWIIASSLSKQEFMDHYHLDGDLCKMTVTGFPVARLNREFLETIGVRIENGATVEIPIDETVRSIFASTPDGSLSNEVDIQNLPSDDLILSTKGGFKSISYPYFEL